MTFTLASAWGCPVCGERRDVEVAVHSTRGGPMAWTLDGIETPPSTDARLAHLEAHGSPASDVATTLVVLPVTSTRWTP